jgi:hypothetical protein
MVTAVMWYSGDAVLRPSLIGWSGAAYWGTCLGFSILTVVFGIGHIRRIVRSIRLNRALMELRANREHNRIRLASVA